MTAQDIAGVFIYLAIGAILVWLLFQSIKKEMLREFDAPTLAVALVVAIPLWPIGVLIVIAAAVQAWRKVALIFKLLWQLRQQHKIGRAVEAARKALEP